MARFILHVKSAAAGDKWPRGADGLEQVVRVADTGKEAREAYEAERVASGAVLMQNSPDATGKDQFQVVKVEAI